MRAAFGREELDQQALEQMETENRRLEEMELVVPAHQKGQLDKSKKVPRYYWRLLRVKIMDLFYKMTYLGLDLDTTRKLGIFPKTCCTTRPFKRLLTAAKEGVATAAKDCLLDDRYLVHHYDFVRSAHQANMTALHYAAKNGHLSIVVMLCEYRADPNARDVLGRSPLYYAFRSGQDAIAEHLLVHFGIPDYELFKVCQSDRAAALLTAAIGVRDSLRGVGFLRKVKAWPDRMRAALSAALPIN